MKKWFVCFWSVILALALAACAKGGNPDGIVTVGTEPHDDSMVREEPMQVPNPWQECKTLEDAAALAGFPFTAPESIEGFSEKYISAIENDIAQVVFDRSDASLSFRKGLGSEDISGDYNTYAITETKTVDGKSVTCRENDGLVYTATWTDETYSYAITSNTGMTAQQLEQWVQSLS